MANFFHDNFMLQNNANVNNSHVNHDVFVIDLNNFNNHSDNGDYDNISLLQTLLNHQQHPHHHNHHQQQHQLQPLQNYHHLNNSTSINHQIVATNILNDEFNCFNVTELEAVPNHLIQWFLITIYSLTSLLALIGNLTVIIVEMYGKESAHNIRKYLINLAISDIIIGVLCVPFTYTDFMLGQWIFPHWLCPTAQFVQLLSVFVTSLTLTFIGIERYMATLHPFSPIHHWLESHTNIILIATWILGSAYAYIPFENTATRAFSLPNNNETIYYECTYDNDVTIIKLRIFMASNILLTFILPLFVLIFSYSAIMRKLISDERRFRKSLSSSKTKHHNETIKSNDDNNNNNSIRDNRTSPPQSTNFGVKFKYKHVNNNQQRSVISKYGDDNTDDFNSIQSINDDNGNGDGDPPNNQKPTINHCRFKQQQPRKCLCLNQPNKTIIYDNDDHKIIGGGGGGGTPNGHCQCTTNIDSNNKNNRLNTMNQTSILSSTLSLSSSVGSSTTTSPPHSASISPIIVDNKCDNHRNRINNDRNDCNDYVDNYDDNLQHQQHRHHHHQQPTTPSTATTTITMTPIICNNSTNQPPPQQFNTGQIDLRKSTPFNHRSKTIKMMFTVILLYGICWMPIKLYQFLNDYGIISYCTEHELYAMVTLYFICHWMAMANSFVNPIIYSFMSKSFRNDFSKISQTFSKNINHLSIKTSLTQV